MYYMYVLYILAVPPFRIQAGYGPGLMGGLFFLINSFSCSVRIRTRLSSLLRDLSITLLSELESKFIILLIKI